MNQDEKICQSYRKNINCFENIPYKFEFDGSTSNDCSFIFPPGYSMYVEKFSLNDPGPDNFVLYDQESLGYSSELKWQNRIQTWWKFLEKSNPLNEKQNKRPNGCIKTLKVICQ